MNSHDIIVVTYKNEDVKVFNFDVSKASGVEKRDRLVEKLRKSDDVRFYELSISDTHEMSLR